MYFLRQFLTGSLLIAQFLGRFPSDEAACYEAKEEADRRSGPLEGGLSVCVDFLYLP